MDGATLSMLILAGVLLPLAAFVTFMVHRERLQDEAEEESHRASGTAAE